MVYLSVLDDVFTVQTPNYYLESRGTNKTDVIISDDEYFIQSYQCRYIYALSQEALDEYIKFTDEKTNVIIYENIYVKELENYKIFDIIRYTYSTLKKPFTVHMISLGIINGLTRIELTIP